MKKIMLGMIVLIMSANTYAQETNKTKEVGIVFRNFDYFGITYRTGSNKSVWRFQSLYLTNSKTTELSDSLDRKLSGSGFTLSIGKEFRKKLSENLMFRYGADISFGYFKSSNIYEDKTILDRDWNNSSKLFSPGLHFVVGINYLVSKNLIIGAELLPGIKYEFGQRTEYEAYLNYTRDFDVSRYSYGFNNNSVRLTIMYRF